MTDISSDLGEYGIGIVAAPSGGGAFSGKRSSLNRLVPFVQPHQRLMPRVRYLALGLILATAEMYLLSVLFGCMFGNGSWRV